MMTEYYGLSRSRDKSGKIVKRNCNPYINCIHTLVENAYGTMEVLIVETYEDFVLQCGIRRNG